MSDQTPPPSHLPVAPTPGSNDTGGIPYCERHDVWHASGPENSCQAWDIAKARLAEDERLRKVNVDAGKLITRLKRELGEKDRAITRVHEVHYPITHAGKQYCNACSAISGLELMPYPCRTIRALAEPEGDHRD